VISVADCAQDFGAGTDVEGEAYGRRAGLRGVLHLDYHAAANLAVMEDPRKAVDDDAARLINHEVLANGRFARQFDSGDHLHPFISHSVEPREELTQRHGPHRVAPAAKAIDDHDTWAE
jgi:hypothetical protein